LLLVGGVYLAAAVPYSLLTPAWEANDEIDHAMYVEHIVAHGSLPRILLANGVESHQPPLYYLLAAAWQKLLRIPAFVPSAWAARHTPAQLASGRYLALSHHYSALGHQDAIYLHELRLLSVALGLATVLLSYGCARLLFARASAAMAVGLAVGLFPKQLVVNSALNNDSLVIALSTLALLLFLVAERARQRDQPEQRRWLMLLMGVALGVAAITKFNSLPLAGLLVLVATLPTFRQRRLLVDSALACVGFVTVSGWWFLRNQALYGQLLASGASMSYLRRWVPFLIEPVPWTNSARFLHFVPSQLFRSVWYDGDWNQWSLPNLLNVALWCFAGLSALSALIASVAAWRRRGQRRGERLSRTANWSNAFAVKGTGALQPWVGALALAGIAITVVAGVVAVLLIAKTTTQAEGRTAFVGLAGFVIFLVLGSHSIALGTKWAGVAAFAWPVVLAGVDLYVLARYVVPFAGL